MKKYFIVPIFWIIYKLIYSTWKIKTIESPVLVERRNNHEPYVLAHWHGDEIVLLSVIGKNRVATITSTSKDGDMMALLVKMVGGKTSRGSSTRGAVGGLKGLIKLIKSGRNCSVAVDGPKGPVYKVKPGVFEISRLLDAPIFYAGVAYDQAWMFPKSWNKTFFPKPFAKVVISWSGPFQKIDKSMDPRSEELARLLENALHNSRAEAFKEIAT